MAGIRVQRTVKTLKASGKAVGQVVTYGPNKYVIVEETSAGLKAICLYYMVVGDQYTEIEIPPATVVWVEVREYWKAYCHIRWGEIARLYPRIDGG